MFATDFNPATALAAVKCPRCGILGLVESDDTAHHAASERDRHMPRVHINPSVYCRCLACGLEAQYPACLDD
ncbi:hypothetical protein E5CHR_02901 [Variovorax sp. PBL-E5]|nr:hypothetical protein E5CHR_02901 [Variovorax sp. PBL-E5]